MIKSTNIEQVKVRLNFFRYTKIWGLNKCERLKLLNLPEQQIYEWC